MEKEDDLDLFLNKVESKREQEEKYRKKLDTTWKKVQRIARDRSETLEIRVAVLKKFLEKYPDNNPYKAKAEGLLRDLCPGTLVVRTEPPGAMVSVLQLKKGKAPLTTKAKGGTYKVKVRLPGFLPAERSVTVEPGETSELVIPLERVPGTLSVTTKPSGATISVNGKEIGVDPVTVEVPSGQCRIVAKLDKYWSGEKTVTVKPRRKTSVVLSLEESKGILMVKTNPPGAMVSIDGLEAGESPLTTEVRIGKLQVKATLEGYNEIEKTVEVPDGEQIEVAFNLEKEKSAPGTLSVETEPPGASVMINGKRAGVAPVEGDVGAGTYKVEVKLEGYQPAEKTFTVHSGKKTTAHFILNR